MTTTDDILRAWLRPVRPFARLIALLFVPMTASLRAMIKGSLDPWEGTIIIVGFLGATIDALYQRSPRGNVFAQTVPPPPPLPFPPPAPPPIPVEDLEDARARFARAKAALLEIAHEIETLDLLIPDPPPAPARPPPEEP